MLDHFFFLNHVDKGQNLLIFQHLPSLFFNSFSMEPSASDRGKSIISMAAILVRASWRLHRTFPAKRQIIRKT